MSFFRKMGAAIRAVNEGRATAEAHRMAESFLDAKLPDDVGADGFSIVSRMAEYSSVEQMAMIYVTVYAERMENYLKAVNATQEFRLKVAHGVARACINFAQLQRNGQNFQAFYIMELIRAAKKLGVDTDSKHVSFKL